MPPVTKAGATQFRKDVDFVTKDDDEQRAAGIVMVPDKVDLQNDFAREETIRGFADQFETFVEAGEAGGGIMHAVFPDDWMDLERNEVLDAAEEIGGDTVAAGAWVQEWAINDDGLWSLISDGILAGYSIGAVQVNWNGPYEQSDDAVDDVDMPEELGEDELVWELTAGIIREVSAVDIPAVPDAQILEAKSMEKRLGDHLGNRSAFIDEALQRGHSETEAARLWDELNRAIEVEGSAAPGDKSWFERAKAFFSPGGPGANVGETADTNPRKSQSAAKEGRTLSKANRHSLFATIDASLDVLQDANVDHGMTRFTDRDEVDFDLSEHVARTWPKPDDEDEDGDEDDKHAAGGDTPETDTETTDMSDTTDDPMADAPEWAKALNDRIDDLEGEKDADEDTTDDPISDAPAWAKALDERIDEIAEKALAGDDADDVEEKPEWAKELESRIDTISQQSGVSTQLESGAGDDSEESGLKGLGKALA